MSHTPRAVPLDDILATCEALVMPQVRARAISFTRVPAAPGLHVMADEEKLQQILLNLLSNAIKCREAASRSRRAATRVAD